MTLPTADVASLLETVDTDGEVAFDGLRIAHTDAGYALETDGDEWHGLERAALEDALEPLAAYVTNWRYWQETVGGEGTARRAFLRWCERAPLADADADADADVADDHPSVDDPLAVPERYDALHEGLDREWGQLCITARLVDDAEHAAGERVYDLWHVDDADSDIADLEVSDEPRDAREIATYDEDGRYRPLKTAPTLPSGWAFTGLSGVELVEAVGYFYPATVANWHRELWGNVDVDHWTETAERQTGIYDVVDELPREAVEWMAEACCVDSQCLRRREWQYDADDELDVDGGDGPFPCREPCSLVIAAARKWTIIESEAEHTYELELTTSEYNQLAELIDAVADGRTDEIREADLDDGANRYRARYLRAKRVDKEGDLEARRLDD
ncbi:DR2241 family protein [Natronolimnohabitans sp. A-GB9]|uniref:DR2241 family protein n=1 Tax=Natronolimnohabitans sp. A-GB9 TaxID=3069757 RepID=UPI0027B47E8D|nr:DR2241 family protein [Natronolimnohabitans sp. A-GB9]MDQ2052015.1 DR2241 family protein [Natronolimnohabitans sp. A-GB9]